MFFGRLGAPWGGGFRRRSGVASAEEEGTVGVVGVVEAVGVLGVVERGLLEVVGGTAGGELGWSRRIAEFVVGWFVVVWVLALLWQRW